MEFAINTDQVENTLEESEKTQSKVIFAGTYLQPHYGNGVFSNVYLSAGQH
jgi:hypothetical protein